MAELVEIPIGQIDIPHPRERDKTEFRTLVSNIRQQGLLHPVKVRRSGPDRYELVFGQGRLEACRELGWMLIPAQITDTMSDEELLLEWLTENLQRVRMSTRDKALNIRRLIDSCGYSKKEVAEKLGVSVATVTSLYKVAVRGSERVRDSLDRGMVASAGQIVRKFDNHREQDSVLDTFEAEHLDTEKDRLALLRSLKKGTVDVKEALSEVRQDHKHYSKLHAIALMRHEKIVPHLATLRRDRDFLTLAKKHGVRL